MKDAPPHVDRRPSVGNSLGRDRTQKADNQEPRARVPQRQGEKRAETRRGGRAAFVATERAADPSWSEDAEEGERGSRSRQNRAQFKERGSLLSRFSEDSAEISTDPRSDRGEVKGKGKGKTKSSARVVKPVNVDVYIPSVVSVGTLARLLNVKLGMSSMPSRHCPSNIAFFEIRCVERWSESVWRPRLSMITVSTISMSIERAVICPTVLTSEYASLLALEFNRNPIINDEAAFDIYPPCVYRGILGISFITSDVDLRTRTRPPCWSGHP